MKKVAIILSFITFFLLKTKPTKAIYPPNSVKNNKIGIHIFQPAEIEEAAKLVNSNGGSWGYITIPIQPQERDKQKWQDFMHKAKELKVIPILRITTIPKGGEWAKGKDTDLVDFANFLSELDWPIQNFYVIIFNEVNRAQEWGGKVDPAKYAKILKNSYLIFKQRSNNFFILPAGLDSALPNSPQSLSTTAFLNKMLAENPDIFSYIDGWTTHSYPNPGFSASPYKTGLQSITGYKQELSIIQKNLPVFITETGWNSNKLNQETLYNYYQIAWKKWLEDKNVAAVTPFILQASNSNFEGLSFLDQNGKPKSSWQTTKDLNKLKGNPKLQSYPSTNNKKPENNIDNLIKQPYFQEINLLFKLEGFLRKLFIIFNPNT